MLTTEHPVYVFEETVEAPIAQVFEVAGDFEAAFKKAEAWVFEQYREHEDGPDYRIVSRYGTLYL